jgi:hypothetical protein
VSKAPKKPHYSAIILSSSGADLGPISISDATDDVEAGKLAMERGGKWMKANGVADARIQIVKDGKGIRTIPVETPK